MENASLNGYMERRRHRSRVQWLRRKYDLTPESYHALLDTQAGQCAVCGRPILSVFSDSPRPTLACVDHDHATGSVRGLLCGICNTGIGWLGDNTDKISRILAYLAKAQNP